jgi:hypothetical protein
MGSGGVARAPRSAGAARHARMVPGRRAPAGGGRRAKSHSRTAAALGGAQRRMTPGADAAAAPRARARGSPKARRFPPPLQRPLDNQGCGPSPVVLYLVDLARLLVFYWAVAADVLLLKARRPHTRGVGCGVWGVFWGEGGRVRAVVRACVCVRVRV